MQRKDSIHKNSSQDIILPAEILLGKFTIYAGDNIDRNEDKNQ